MLNIDIGFNFTGFTVNIFLNVDRGQIFGIYGKSGIGKSSLLKAIAGITQPKRGSIKYENEIWFDKSTWLSPQQRKSSLVFQDYALFPNLSVEKNIRFTQNLSNHEVEEIIATFELTDLLKKRPFELSGGQQQRVAIARSLISRPSLLLMDEPFSALDDKIKSKVQQFLSSYIDQHQVHCLYVSHDKSDLLDFTHDSYEVVEKA